MSATRRHVGLVRHDERVNEEQLRDLAQQSLDATVLEGAWADTDPKSYLHGFMSGFRTLGWSLRAHDADVIRDAARILIARADAVERGE